MCRRRLAYSSWDAFGVRVDLFNALFVGPDVLTGAGTFSCGIRAVRAEPNSLALPICLN